MTDAVGMLWKLIQFYDAIDRDHADGEAKLLDEAAAVVAAAQIPAPAQPVAVSEARERVLAAIADLQGEHEVMAGPFDPTKWKIDISVSDLQALASQPSPAATVETDLREAAKRVVDAGGEPGLEEAIRDMDLILTRGAAHNGSSADRESQNKAYAEDWHRQIINAGGDENVAQQAVTLAALNGLFDHLNEPQTLPVGPRELKPITMSDVRLRAGEGKLFPADVLNAVNAVLKMRLSSLLPRPQSRTGEA